MMCGIYCSLTSHEHLLSDEVIQQRLEKRGPDSYRTVNSSFSRHSSNNDTRQLTHVTLCSTVLGLRGSVTAVQPFQDSEGGPILCWNGEAWRIGDQPTAGNDTAVVHGLLKNALQPESDSLKSNDSTSADVERVAAALSTISGPYAFVFYDHEHGRLFFGRDFLGRRSLLWKVDSAGNLIMCSVSDGNSTSGWQEIEADGVYCIKLQEEDITASRAAEHIRQFGNLSAEVAPYQYSDEQRRGANYTVLPRLSLSREMPSQIGVLDESSPSVDALQSLLQISVSSRVLGIPDPPVLATRVPYDLARLGVLFSGGLDCTVLARLCHDELPASEPIDLFNVAFENPRIHKTDKSGNHVDAAVYETCPDRITGWASFAELQQTCLGREWRFIAINVPYEETIRHRSTIISLMHPHNTEMDLSISYALYFAARGTGSIYTSVTSDPAPYTTSARVLLSGLGSDELFGGYTRHATAYRHRGFPGLLDELELDVARLGKRNLGRDDRVMSHWSKEVRFPFLDERLLSWALNVPVTEKCGFGEPRSVEDEGNDIDSAEALEPGKKVLRCLAWRLGMRKVAREKKRAIQFGARTAKMETGKTKGTNLVS